MSYLRIVNDDAFNKLIRRSAERRRRIENSSYLLQFVRAPQQLQFVRHCLASHILDHLVIAYADWCYSLFPCFKCGLDVMNVNFSWRLWQFQSRARRGVFRPIFCWTSVAKRQTQNALPYFLWCHYHHYVWPSSSSHRIRHDTECIMYAQQRRRRSLGHVHRSMFWVTRWSVYVPLQICHIKISRMYLECCFLKHEIKLLCDQKLLINYLKTLTSNTNHIGLAYFIRPTLPVPAGAAYSSRQRPYPLAGWREGWRKMGKRRKGNGEGWS